MTRLYMVLVFLMLFALAISAVIQSEELQEKDGEYKKINDRNWCYWCQWLRIANSAPTIQILGLKTSKRILDESFLSDLLKDNVNDNQDNKRTEEIIDARQTYEEFCLLHPNLCASSKGWVA
ncbi:uncharacterized protein [Amphiura filiformis]|uniref:uncharacterized protein isoform X2 n=1 Tax=Amphiura filiformis TaxID=82378 RepID=UPI003B215921